MIKCTIRDEELKPHIGSEGSAGMDLRIPYDICLAPGQETDLVSTGFCLEIPENCFGLVVPRSSIGNLRIGLANTAGIIDSDYRGEIKFKLVNTGKETRLLYRGDRIMQLIIVPYIQPKLLYVKELSKTDRGDKGFGSTGKA